MKVTTSPARLLQLIRLAPIVALSLMSVEMQALDITLAWDAMEQEEGVLHYTVYLDNGSGSKIFALVPFTDEPTVQVRGLVPGVRYFFHVTATSFWGESPPSNVITFGEVPEDQRRSFRRGGVPSPYKKPELK